LIVAEFLTPERHNASGHYHDPYTTSGARSILRRFKDDVIAMLDDMDANRQLFDDGKTMLAKSPLRSKVHVAAAMKTMGLIEERPTQNGSCALVLTEKAIRQMADLKKYL
jgi:hypothetical protein